MYVLPLSLPSSRSVTHPPTHSRLPHHALILSSPRPAPTPRTHSSPFCSGALPKDGPVKPSQDDQLTVSRSSCSVQLRFACSRLAYRTRTRRGSRQGGLEWRLLGRRQCLPAPVEGAVLLRLATATSKSRPNRAAWRRDSAQCIGGHRTSEHPEHRIQC